MISGKGTSVSITLSVNAQMHQLEVDPQMCRGFGCFVITSD